MGILYLFAPIALTIVTALVSYPLLRSREFSPGRVGVAVLGLEALATAATIGLAARVNASTEDRCESETSSLDIVLWHAGWVVAAIGGIALAALRVDARRHGGTLYWHLPAGVVIFVLPYVAFVAALFALLCLS